MTSASSFSIDSYGHSTHLRPRSQWRHRQGQQHALAPARGYGALQGADPGLRRHHGTQDLGLAVCIGGAQIYAQALPLADAVEVTEIGRDFEGDAFAPELGASWQAVSRSEHVSANGLPYCFVRFERRS